LAFAYPPTDQTPEYYRQSGTGDGITGEKTKSLKHLEKIYTFLLRNKFDRKSLIIAFGGGVIGDIAGAAAATFIRGNPWHGRRWQIGPKLGNLAEK
jgi:hypothetical protein